MKKKIFAIFCCAVLCMAFMAGCGSSDSDTATDEVSTDDEITGTYDGTITSITIKSSEAVIEFTYEYNGETQESSLTATDDSAGSEEEMTECFDEAYTLKDADGNEISIADLEEGASIYATFETGGEISIALVD